MLHHQPDINLPLMTRRQLLERTGGGFGMLALSAMQASAADGHGSSSHSFDLQPKPPQIKPQAKNVILLMAVGGASQMDLFDPKPTLTRHNGQTYTTKVEVQQKGSEQNRLLASPFKFYRRGECGMEFSDVIPHMGRCVDDLCLVRSMHTGHNNHGEGLIMLVTGNIFQGRPSLGSWISYGLGSENQNLPSFVVLRSPDGYTTSGTSTWSSGWMPGLFRGTEFGTQGTPILNLRSAREQPAGAQRNNLDFLKALNRAQQREYPLDSRLETRIQNHELAARMQTEALKMLDVADEPSHVQKLYGLDNPQTRKYGLRCLLARKLVEAGVRFIQIMPQPFQPWDHHTKLVGSGRSMTTICGACDLPTAGLLNDLKQRGLLESTIVLFTGEFGRLPVAQGGAGRDHNRNAFSLWLAGGGFKGGHIHGATDEVGYKATENRVSVSDLHATILHQLGLDHDRVSYRHAGRDETLTDSLVTYASVVPQLINRPVA